ncbi:TlpA family protein disulfide reductase [Actinoplanes siamensis]|uniref:Thioredoxin n=1 Tax=Actinoplanes siamensis TaxID=1223317 RepID=A0A919NBB4_9ACTN|nr:TlpA disulfide reductase family protein [Actinoplanes siamensis]GIF07741.1 thioredoxin [Actinoplanes siamensis]
MRAFPPVLAAVLLLAGCTSTESPAEQVSSPFVACAAAAGAASPPAAGLPDISVDCFAGGDAVSLRGLHGPAVINIWATFCGPCREELPLIQRLADATAGKLTVLGLNTGDTRSAAASFGTDHGVSMPTLFDPDRKAITALGVVNLPSTIFVDARGQVYTHRDTMDAAELTELVRQHAGLSVTL